LIEERLCSKSDYTERIGVDDLESGF
jgi:hypothetical protein